MGFRRCIILAKEVSENIQNDDAEIFIFRPDHESIAKYYAEYRFPIWLRNYLANRHIRILTSSGRWVGLRRRLSKTPRYAPEDKFRKEIKKLYRRRLYPIKLYYSIARMINPIAEYGGRGYPLPYVVGVFDVDIPDKNIPIHYKSYVETIKKTLEERIRIIEKYLRSRGYKTRILFSGKKGYHIYIFDSSLEVEFPVKQLEELIDSLGDLVDNYNFRDKSGHYDLHRIVKLPYTIDQATGLTVQEKPKKIPRDTIYRYKE
ncbi:MAG: hypothetical protein Q6363_001485 [Candidatus Njordarchaeota archaeon]